MLLRYGAGGMIDFIAILFCSVSFKRRQAVFWSFCSGSVVVGLPSGISEPFYFKRSMIIVTIELA